LVRPAFQKANADALTGIAYTFTVYAVDTAGNKNAGVSTGPWTPGFNIDDVGSYLNTAHNAGTDYDPNPLTGTT
jgi:hypothetical protein